MMRIKILYGSQTGNAQDSAEKIYRYALNLPLKHCASSLQEMNFLNIDEISKEDILIFICSTTGQGDPPENMKIFWNNIMSRSFNKNLSLCNFAVFGLGDSKYKDYNFIAKKLFRRLLQLQSSPLLPIGLADDQHPFGIDGEFLPWVEKLWECISFKLSNYMDTTNLFERCTRTIDIFKYDFTVNEIDSVDYTMKCFPGLSSIEVKSNNRETPTDHFQETRLITFKNEKLTYNVSDVLCIFPQNSQSNIDLFFTLSKLDKNLVITVRSLDISYAYPQSFPSSPTSISDLVKHCFDLNCTPRKSFFEILSTFSTHETEKEKLLELSLPSNLDELYSYCFQPKRSVVEVLQDFPNTTKELNLFQWLNVMPFIRPREYSIASSPLINVGEISILVAVVRYKTKMLINRVGLCTDFLSKLTCNDVVFGKIKNGSLRFPKDGSPIILISPGTGIAAFRGFILERISESCVSEMLFCYGCRYRDKDFYFSNELLQFRDDGKLKLVTAFSREEDCYIQNKLKYHSALIWKILIDLSGYIFISGRSVDMPQQINDEIKRILIKEGNLQDNQASNILLRLEKQKKYQTETWS